MQNRTPPKFAVSCSCGSWQSFYSYMDWASRTNKMASAKSRY